MSGPPASPSPIGGAFPGEELCFALLEHAGCSPPGWPDPHFDLLLEDPSLPGDRRCRTWRLRADPRASGAAFGAAIEPHRAGYLDYEGPVSGGRGAVRRLDGGGVVWESRDPPVAALFGAALSGRWVLPAGAGRAVGGVTGAA